MFLGYEYLICIIFLGGGFFFHFWIWDLLPRSFFGEGRFCLP